MSTSSSKMSKARIALFVVLGLVVVTGAVLAALLAIGTRFERNMKRAEASQQVRTIARFACQCAGAEDADQSPLDGPEKPKWRGLPATSRAVPATLASVTGKKYESSPSDWSAEPWKCMHFEITEPLKFQYRWTRRSDTEGIAEASGDLDGNGEPDAYVAQEVHCTVGPTRTTCMWSSPLIDEQGNAASAGLR